ncbi:Gfo/Idh/MocA family protein [Fontibacillus sp. BL9]|uniref:Gfo/Idh/MocA family protein n=1 Tax=Fontibacillus sp. BL9 TaxID=3389971 RepID=UPI00397A031A
MRALVIGYGSIGERHARLLQDLNIDTGVVSQRAVRFPTAYSDIFKALELFEPQYIIIANKTSKHFDMLNELTNQQWKGKLLIEKPLFHKSYNSTFREIGNDIYVGYNLRFHPILQKLKHDLEDQKIISVIAYTGQYLPSWRPARNYKLSYSSNIEEGGGVLRDLSHELDYLTWMFGPWKRLCSIGGHYSSLDINGDDTFGITMETSQCPLIQVQINYLDRYGRRELIVVTDEHTYKADLVGGRYQCDDQIFEITVERDFTYIEQHKAILSDDRTYLCSFEEGVEVMRLIEAVEVSAQSKGWVENE